MALEQNKLDASATLFEQALQLSPHSIEAQGGLTLVADFKSGKKTRQKVLEQLRKRTVIRREGGKRKIVVLEEADERPDAPAAPDPLEDFKARQRIAEQQANTMVSEAVRQANRVVRVNPDEAYELLKQTLDGVRTNLDLPARRSTPWRLG